MALDDTITALATPPGEGGIAVIRLSGPESVQIAKSVFVNRKKQKKDKFRSRYFYYGYILDDDQEVIDEVLLVYMQAPKTYTREDVVEIHCHGGMIPVRRILELLMKKGARLAEPGEFTKRAFLNGRIDLAQAEAVMDLISSKTDNAARASVNQMQGSLSREIKAVRDDMLDLLARIEVTVDYPEEDIESMLEDEVRSRLMSAREKCRQLLESAHQGRLIREGIKTVIIGKPNVGKSSLLNALVRENRAIVTDIPGTTRDVIEEYVNIKGVLVRILDTAGIRETKDLVEKIGVEKSRELTRDADLILLLLDSSQPLEKEDIEILQMLKDKKILILLNKSDKPAAIDEEDIRKLTGSTIIKTSMIDGTGLDEVEDYIYNMVYSGKIEPSNPLMITSNRHKEALIRAEKHLGEALETLDALMPLDMVSIDIRNVWEALGEITGESLTENLIDKIFSEFCLGK
ncbi:MAG: tRNA uridine-5-carboxymethylaminomethyl(34) synthesis GTPase MnmE [Clostridiales bacterium]|jgi:tRNA modification GTPase|nr:tRNA uridine-5-carboxymethylaminomethyl(34) synthesis GTPase MnmE [Clostridiales bacterium]